MSLKELIEKGDAAGIEALMSAKVEEETSGLKAKNNELLGKLKKSKETTDGLQSQFDELREAIDAKEAEAAAKDGDIEKIRSQMTAKHETAMEAVQKQLAAEQAVNRKLLVDNGLTSALTEAGVKTEYLPAVRALIQSSTDIELVDLDGQRSAQIGGENLKDYVTAWAQTDQGKAFVAAPDNSGGGANGSGSGNPQGKTMTREAFNQLPPREQSAVMKQGTRLTDA